MSARAGQYTPTEGLDTFIFFFQHIDWQMADRAGRSGWRAGFASLAFQAPALNLSGVLVRLEVLSACT